MFNLIRIMILEESDKGIKGYFLKSIGLVGFIGEFY